jgi:hypothetical protein
LAVSGALAFQTNVATAAATQLVGQVFQIGSLPLLNTLLHWNSPAQVAVDRLFLALVRETDAPADPNSLNLTQDNLWNDAALRQKWLTIPTQADILETRPFSSANTDRTAVVDKVFTQLADDMDFSDFGGD